MKKSAIDVGVFDDRAAAADWLGCHGDSFPS
jgi:hypothetical protein